MRAFNTLQSPDLLTTHWLRFVIADRYADYFVRLQLLSVIIDFDAQTAITQSYLYWESMPHTISVYSLAVCESRRVSYPGFDPGSSA